MADTKPPTTTKKAAKPSRTKAQIAEAARVRDEKKASDALSKADLRLTAARQRVDKARAEVTDAEQDLIDAEADHTYAAQNPKLPKVDPTVQPGSNPPADTSHVAGL